MEDYGPTFVIYNWYENKVYSRPHAYVFVYLHCDIVDRQCRIPSSLNVPVGAVKYSPRQNFLVHRAHYLG